MTKTQLDKEKQKILKRMKRTKEPMLADVYALLALNRDLARLNRAKKA